MTPRELGTKEARRAYAYVLGQYLGDGCVSAHRRGVYRLRVTCANDWPGVMDRLEAALSVLMPANVIGRHVRKGMGCTEVSLYSKRWPVLLPQVGDGMKHRRTIALARWQEAIVYREFPEEFVCGLIHSDGCRAINNVDAAGRTYSYPRYFFSNRSEDIHELFATALAALGISPTRSGWQQSIARKDDVALLDDLGARKDWPYPGNRSDQVCPGRDSNPHDPEISGF